MKKFYLAIAIIAAASIADGCSKEPTQPTPVAKEKITLTAGEIGTKTFGTTTIKFNAGDKLSVFDSKGENNEFSLTSAAASTSGTTGIPTMPHTFLSSAEYAPSVSVI